MQETPFIFYHSGREKRQQRSAEDIKVLHSNDERHNELNVKQTEFEKVKFQG